MKKLILIATLLFIFTIAAYPNEYVINDGIRHYHKMINDCEGIDWAACEGYPILYHQIGSLFVNDGTDFFIFNAFLIFFLIPIGFSLISGIKELGLFYLLFTNISLLTFDGGTFPSIIAIMFWVGFLLQKDWRIKVILFILAALTHNASVVLFAITIFASIIKEVYYNFKEKGFLFSLPYTYDISKFLEHPEWHFSSYLISIFPVTLVIGLLEIFKQKKIHYLIIGLAALIWSLQTYRAFFVVILIALIGFTDFYTRQPRNIRTAIIGFGIVNLILNYYFTWFK